MLVTHPSFARWPRALVTAVAIVVAAFALALAVDAVRPLVSQPSPTNRPLPATVIGRTATERVERLQDVIRAEPTHWLAHRELGLAFLQRARETADPAYYPRADAALARAYDLNRADVETLVGLGALALARHQFADALAWGEQARAIDPRRASPYGVIGDAQVELGLYDEALDTVQTMVDLRPDLASYARVSYLRELQGDLPGAIQAMRLAANAGQSYGEAGAWARVQLGHLLLKAGAIEEAEREYRWVLAANPADVTATAGLGRAQLTAGDYTGAIPFYEDAVARMPLPEYVLALGDLDEAVGRSEDAARQFDLARALQALVVANGGNADLELALFEAERCDPARALALAEAEVARRSSIHAYDALAWALYHTGDYPAARTASQQALRLGTEDGLMLFHAAMIDLKLGDRASAKGKLATALRRDPGFSARHVPAARALLAQLEVE